MLTSVYKIRCNLVNLEINSRKPWYQHIHLKWQNCSVGLKYRKLNWKSKWNNKSEKNEKHNILKQHCGKQHNDTHEI